MSLRNKENQALKEIEISNLTHDLKNEDHIDEK